LDAVIVQQDGGQTRQINHAIAQVQDVHTGGAVLEWLRPLRPLMCRGDDDVEVGLVKHNRFSR